MQTNQQLLLHDDSSSCNSDKGDKDGDGDNNKEGLVTTLATHEQLRQGEGELEAGDQIPKEEPQREDPLEREELDRAPIPFIDLMLDT